MMSVSGSGTFAYMAPEVWGGHANAMSDQYSLAYSYAELRLGRRPFTHTDFASLMFDHMQRSPDLAPMSDDEQRVVLQALAKSPENRFPTCVDFARALERLAATPPIRPRTDRTPPSGGGRRSRRSPAPIGTRKIRRHRSPPPRRDDDDEREPGRFASLLPGRTSHPAPDSAAGEGQSTRTAPLPPAIRRAGPPPSLGRFPGVSRGRRPRRGRLRRLANFFSGGASATPASIALVAPAALVLHPGEKNDDPLPGRRGRTVNDAVPLTGTARRTSASGRSTSPPGPTRVAVEVSADRMRRKARQ